jgi:hypothetical protein
MSTNTAIDGLTVEALKLVARIGAHAVDVASQHAVQLDLLKRECADVKAARDAWKARAEDAEALVDAYRVGAALAVRDTEGGAP